MDDKRLKRILANRQSAARSKERKIRYTIELEKRVQILRTEATNLSAQLTMLQRHTTYLAARNMELKMKLEALRQRARLREELNAALKEEVQYLRGKIIRFGAITGNSFGVLYNQLASQLAMQQLTNPPPQQPQLGMPPPPSAQPSNGQRRPNFMNFSQKK